MPIYTRTGDSGMTGLYGGKRISKADCQIETYGSIDELTSYIGLVVVKLKNKEEADFLVEIQKDLYQIMGFLSGAKINLSALEKKVTKFEKRIDLIEEKLPKLNKFIIPGSNEISSLFQILRVLCRKAERKNIDFFNKTTISGQQLTIVKYLNRLSDLFFDLARKYGKNNEVVL
ncbi:MAG: cob(I)yrinic acid a,c-diamide adenosyltransferase [Candidatus Roizmanbacteria bacterium]|nr:cob(I)yrinic acid a,c-diamide adenosyltransferase [Candidatus Roizmanbacteria bacterium]